MAMPTESLEDRTERFALDVIKLIRTFPSAEPGPTVKRQLAKSATAQAANYRASVAEEEDDSFFWLRLALKSSLSNSTDLPRLVKESDELTAISSKMVGTGRRNERLAKRK
jgi:hypothetical protein